LRRSGVFDEPDSSRDRSGSAPAAFTFGFIEQVGARQRLPFDANLPLHHLPAEFARPSRTEIENAAFEPEASNAVIVALWRWTCVFAGLRLSSSQCGVPSQECIPTF
jgi:hypothetical protein